MTKFSVCPVLPLAVDGETVSALVVPVEVDGSPEPLPHPESRASSPSKKAVAKKVKPDGRCAILFT